MIIRSRSGRYGTLQYCARVAVANTCRRVLEQIQEGYGGILVNQRRGPEEWNPAYGLVWTGGMIGPLLSSIGPHLRVKQEQASVLAKFLRHRMATRQGRSGRFFAPLPEEVLAAREAYRTLLRQLNARGTARLS